MNTHTQINTQISKTSRIGVIGAGPAGVSFAYFLRKQGFSNITLLESAPHISGKSSSFEVGGRGYDVGALMVGTNYHNIRSLASALSCPLELFKGRALDIDNGVLIHEDTDMICIYQQLLPHINHYLGERSCTQDVANPGHGILSEEQLFPPIGQYLKGKQMEYLRDAWALAFTSAGYGYMDSDIPAAYFLKFIECSENKISYFPGGFSKLWDKMVEGINVITQAHVTKVDRSLAKANVGPILVTYQGTYQQTVAFDYLIIASNPQQTEPFLDATPEETTLFKQVVYFDYYTIIATVEGLSTKQGLTTIPKYCQDKGYVGHITAFYCAYEGIPTYSFYAYGSTEITQEKVIEYFREDIEKMGGSLKEIHYTKHWDFFPHVNSLSMARGFYSKAEGLQGQHNTFYTGGWLDLELTESCVSYSKDLVYRFFSDTPNESQHLPVAPPVEVKQPSHMNLGLVLKSAAEKYPEKCAFTWVNANLKEEMQLTYAQLYRKARSVAQFLVTKGHKKGDRVLLCYAPGLKFLPILFGCFMCGVIAVPVAPPNLSTAQKDIARFTYLTSTTGARICFSDKDYLQYTRFYASKALVGFVDKIKWPEGLTWIEGETIPPKNLYDERLIAQIDPNDVAVLQFSSGSTGDPKGVMLTHKNLIHNVDLMQAETGIDTDSVFAFWVPQFHDLGLIGGFLNTVRAASRSIVMSPLTFLQRPEVWLQMISKYRADFTAAPNFAYELAARKCSDKTLESLDLSSLIGAFNGAEPVRWSTLHAFSKKFENAGFNLAAFKCLYGLAEHCAYTVGFRNTHGVPTVIDVDPQDLLSGRVTIRSNPSMPNRIVATGVPNTSMQVEVRIVDPNTRLLCPPNVVGEVWISSPSVGEGYYGKEELSEEVFRAKLHNNDDDQDRGCFLRTGDLGFMHKGQLFVTGRLKDVIIINGKNHYPHDIELTVQQCHPRIRPGCVAALHHHDPSRGTDTLIILAEIRDDREKLELGAIIHEISRMVPANHGLSAERVALLKPHSIPKTTSGKLQRARTKAMLMGGELDKKILFSDGDLKEKAKPSLSAPVQVALTHAEISEIIKRRVQKISKLVPQASDIDETTNLVTTYGFDSLAAVQLTSSLKDDFKVEIPPTLLYDIPTVEGLAKHVAKLLPSAVQKSESVAPPPSSPTFASPPSPTFAPPSVAEIESTLSNHVRQISRIAAKLEQLEPKANIITDYGFDSLAAVQLTALIRASFQIEVAPAVVYDIYTISGLAEHIYSLMSSRSPRGRRREVVQDKEILNAKTTPLLVPLAPKNVSNRNNPALFCIHPLLGNVAAYVHISRVIGITRPVYGIQSPAHFPADITVLAKRYADLIQREQPSGPYFLCGYSYGGLIAWEIAKQIASLGEKIGGLFLVDAPSPLAQTVKPIREDEEPHLIWEEEIEQLLSDVDSQWMMRKRASDPSQIDDLKRLIGRHIQSMYSYMDNISILSAVQPFPIHYWRAKDLSKTSALLLDHPYFHEPSWGWRQYKGSITFYNATPGHHYSVLTEDNCGRLGRELDRAIPKYNYNRRTSAELRPLMLEKIARPCLKSSKRSPHNLTHFLSAKVPLYYVIAITIAISYTMQRLTIVI